MAMVSRIRPLFQRSSVIKSKRENALLIAQNRSFANRVLEIGKVESSRPKNEPYDTGQVFLHKAFQYRGVVLFPWKVKVKETVKVTKADKGVPEVNPHQTAASDHKETSRDKVTFRWFYTIMMDARDINHNSYIQHNPMTVAHQESGNSIGEPFFDFASHEDILPFKSCEEIPVHNPRYYDLMLEENSEITREKFRQHHWLQLKDVYKQTTENIQITVMPSYLFCDKENSPREGGAHDRKFYYWRYHIRMENLGDHPVTLRNRCFYINALPKQAEEKSHFQVVRGAGVIGKNPRLTPERRMFQYSSHVALQSSGGFMMGKYTMEYDSGNLFECNIPLFNLDCRHATKSSFENLKGNKM